ncbi:hypothetical protein ACWEWX_24390 [Streptomyces asiaticus]
MRRDPNPQLAFTTGIHYCLGAHLARLEAGIALNTILDRYAEFTLTGLEWYPTYALCNLKRLTFDIRRT